MQVRFDVAVAAKRKAVEPETLHEHLAWAYANLARAHAAVGHGAIRYGTVHHVIRAKLYKGLTTGSMSLGSIFDDEKLKVAQGAQCSYCDATHPLALDHLMPRARGLGDRPDNLIAACRPCNSSKRDRDCVTWLLSRGEFPRLMLLRRYLKVAFAISIENRWLDLTLPALGEHAPPFDTGNFPLHFPDLSILRL